MINAGQFSAGLRAGLAWNPEDILFYPSLNLSYGRARLPLQEAGKSVAAINFNYLAAMLNENYVVTLSRSQLLLYAGIGGAYLNKKSVGPPGTTRHEGEIAIDSTQRVSKLFPEMNIGLEYSRGELAGKNLYLAVGLNLRYTFLSPGRNAYFLRQAGQGNTFYYYQSSLTGNLITPNVYVSLHYKIHRK